MSKTGERTPLDDAHGLRQRLLSGAPLHFGKDAPAPQRTIQGGWLEEAVHAGVRVEVQGALVSGPCSLRYTVVKDEVLLTGCEFADSFDASYSTMQRNLDLSASTFKAPLVLESASLERDVILNDTSVLGKGSRFSGLRIAGVLRANAVAFGDDVDALFDGALFSRPVSLRGARFGGSAHFGGACFRGTAEFQAATFSKAVIFNSCEFSGDAFFRPLDEKWGAAAFHGETDFIGARFAGQAHFQAVQFKAGADFDHADFGDMAFFGASSQYKGAVFEGRSNFSKARFHANADFDGVAFRGRANFGGTEFQDVAYFGGLALPHRRAAFDDEAQFYDCVFRGPAHFLGVVFAKAAAFRFAQFCNHAGFHGATFRDRVTFNGAQFLKSAFFCADGLQPLPGTLFEGAVDFKTATFAQQAHFEGAVFGKAVEFGSTVLAGPAFFCSDAARKCDGTVFRADADFASASFGSSGDFSGARFEAEANFSSASFGSDAIFRAYGERGSAACRFAGPALFPGVRVGADAVFQGCAFARGVTLNNAVVGGSLSCAGLPEQKTPAVVVDGDASFIRLRVGGLSDFRGVQFKGNADFNSAELLGGAYFRGERRYDMPAAVFEGTAGFVAAHFGAAAEFTRVQFRKRADFYVSRFDAAAQFAGATFEDDADFTQVRVRGAFSFDNDADAERGAQFRGDAAFGGARCEEVVGFRNAAFTGRFTMNLAKMDAEAFFHDARFAGETDFRGAYFGRIADFQGAVFERIADLYAVQCAAIGRFDTTIFKGELELRDASVRILNFGETGKVGDQAQFQGSISMQGCTYERIAVDTPSLLARLVSDMRQPYAQLEKALRATGHDRAAENVYVHWKRRERAQELDDGHVITWFGSWLYDTIARYGVRPIRLVLGASVLSVCLGSVYFNQPGTVVPKDDKAAGESKAAIRLAPHAAVGFSLRQFLPVEIPVASAWVAAPSGDGHSLSWPEIWSAVLKTAGWILVPWGVAILTGLLRLKPKD